MIRVVLMYCLLPMTFIRFNSLNFCWWGKKSTYLDFFPSVTTEKAPSASNSSPKQKPTKQKKKAVTAASRNNYTVSVLLSPPHLCSLIPACDRKTIEISSTFNLSLEYQILT